MLLPFACMFCKLVSLRCSSSSQADSSSSSSIATCLLVVGPRQLGIIDLATNTQYYCPLPFEATCVQMIAQNVHSNFFKDMLLFGGTEVEDEGQSFLYFLDLSLVTMQNLNELSFCKQEVSRSSQIYSSLCYTLEVGLAVVVAADSAGDVSFFEFFCNRNRSTYKSDPDEQSIVLRSGSWRRFRADPCGITSVKMGAGPAHELLLYTLGNSSSNITPSFQVWSFAPDSESFSRHTAGNTGCRDESFTCMEVEDLPGCILLGSRSGLLYRYSGQHGTFTLKRDLDRAGSSVVALLVRNTDIVVATDDGCCQRRRVQDLESLPASTDGDGLSIVSYIDRIQLDPNEEEQVVLCNILGGVYFEKIESC